jgi:hypothetical protein
MAKLTGNKRFIRAVRETAFGYTPGSRREVPVDDILIEKLGPAPWGVAPVGDGKYSRIFNADVLPVRPEGDLLTPWAQAVVGLRNLIDVTERIGLGGLDDEAIPAAKAALRKALKL